MNIELVKLEELAPAAYNPRVSDPRRLDLIELSLRKLGFVLPVYAARGGEILSGHQRQLVARRMGATMMPRCLIPDIGDGERKAINIAFNRGTNDLKASDTPADVTSALRRVDIDAMAAQLPDIEPDTTAFYPCMNTVSVPLDRLTRANAGHWNNYARNMARMLYMRHIEMPVVIDPDYRVINGIGRVQLYAEKRKEKADCVMLSHAQAAFAEAMLNLLTMDFDIHNRYKDLLRYNSFRRSRRSRSELGRGFIFAVAPNLRSKDFDIREPASLRKWVREHGTRIVDFGAGHLHETSILRDCGVSVAAFEPFRISEADTIDKGVSVALARDFLSRIGGGEVYSSVFISSVLNSVPFFEDRRHIACICAALCGDRTKLYATASGVDTIVNKVAKGEEFISVRASTYCTFALDYEPNITIGDFGEHPKVQKYHTAKDFYDLFSLYFERVNAYSLFDNTHAVCMSPRRDAILRDLPAALAFEFDLPYPDGSRMGLVDEATAAFEKRREVMR